MEPRLTFLEDEEGQKSISSGGGGDNTNLGRFSQYVLIISYFVLNACYLLSVKSQF